MAGDGRLKIKNALISVSDKSSLEEAKSSDNPKLIFEIVFAVAGAIKIKSDHLDKEI